MFTIRGRESLRVVTACIVSWFLLPICFTAVAIAQPRATIVVDELLTTFNAPRAGKLDAPFGVDFDAAGNMYIVELAGGRVHKVGPEGDFKTIAGNGQEGYAGDGGAAEDAVFNGMHNVAATPAGDLYIADSWNHCIRKIDGKTGIITTVAGIGKPGFSGDGGPAKQAQFDFLMCVTLNSTNDKIYCADLKNHRIRVVDLKTHLIHTVAGNGRKGIPKDGAKATTSPLVDPRAVAVDSNDNVYILERAGHALRVVTPDGVIRTVAGTGEQGNAVGPALESEFGSPKHVAVDANDDVLIADDQNARIVKYNAKEKSVSVVLGKGVEDPKLDLSHPHGVCIHADGSIYVVDTGHRRIVRLHPY